MKRAVRGCMIVWVVLMNLMAGTGLAAADGDSQYRLTRRLIETGMTDAAVAELERFVLLYPDDGRARSAKFAIGQVLFQAGRYRQAISALDPLTAGEIEEALQVRAAGLKSRSYQRLGETGQARLVLQNALHVVTTVAARDQIYWQLGWLGFETGLGDQARQALSAISPQGRQTRDVPRLEAAIGQAASLPQKRPALAGSLSLMPGLGYLYCNRPRDAWMSFLINAALIGATWEAFENDLPVLGGLIGLVETGFYGGNIYGSIAAAHKDNRRRHQLFIENLKTGFDLKIGFRPEDNAVFAGMTLSF